MEGMNFAPGQSTGKSAQGMGWKLPVLVALGAVVVGGAGIFWFLTGRDLPVASFTLQADISDSAGVPSDSTFTLNSSQDLSAKDIEKNLHTRPEVALEVEKNGTGTYTIKPAEKLPEDKVLAVSIDGDVADRTYSWAFPIKAPLAITTAIPGHQGSGVPTDTGIEITFNRSGIRDPEQYISIEPAVPVKFQTDDDTVTLIPQRQLAPATVYTVRVKAGLGAAGTEDTLASDAVISFETVGLERTYPGYDEYFGLDRTFWDFPTAREAVFSAQAGTGVTQVGLSVYRFSDAEDFTRWYDELMNPQWGWSYYNRNERSEPPADRRVWTGNVPVERSELNTAVRVPQALDKGFYLARFLQPGSEYPVLAWFQMTPLVNYLATSGDNTLIALRSGDDGRPVSGATVWFGGTEVGRSGNDGVALFPTPPKLVQLPEEGYPLIWGSVENFFTVRAGGDSVMIPVESQYGWYWRIMPPDHFWSYISEDKTIYRPSDTLRFWGLVKQRNGEDLRNREVTIELSDGYWFEGDIASEDITTYGRTRATISDFYTLQGEIPLSGLEPRTYQLIVRMGNEVIISDTITVQDYVKPAYKLELVPDRLAVFAGDDVRFTVRANFFDGTPVGRMAVRYTGFGTSADSIEGTVDLDAQGEGSFSITIPYVAESGGFPQYWPQYLAMRVSPVQEEEAQISATSWVNVFGPSVYLDVRQTERDKGATTRFDLRLRNVDLEAGQKQEAWFDPERDKAVPGRPVTATVTKITWHREQTSTGYDPISKTTYPIYRFWDERTVVRNETLMTDGNGAASLEQQLENDAGYEFDFVAVDDRGRRETQKRYAYRYTWFANETGTGVSLRNPDEEHGDYRVGDQFTAQMYDLGGRDLPSDSGAFIFVRLVNGLHSYTVQNDPVYRDTFQDEYVPNIQVLGVYYDGSRFLDTPPVNYSFKEEQRKLDIEVTRDKERYRPGDDAALSVRVTDQDGRPQQAEVNVAALDEAVFSLNPDAKDILSFTYRDAFASLLTRSSHQEPLNTAGAEGGGCFLPGTHVLTPGGEVPIESIRAGDEVLTRATDGRTVRARVAATSSHMVRGYLVLNGHIRVTDNHRMSVNGGWLEAGRIAIGDRLMAADGSSVPVTTIERIDDRVRVHNFEVQPAHTYVAEGVWVHNEEKGGGEVRSDFKDLALFTTVRTNGDGRATVPLRLPDDITSWRVTFQAVTRDLKVGMHVEQVPVSLPFFVDAVLNRTYLVGDRPLMRIRTFGTEVPDAGITYSVDAPTLPTAVGEKEGGRSMDVDLGVLPAGTHSVTISATGGSLRDAIRRRVEVTDSYFVRRAADFYELSPGLTLTPPTAGGTTRMTFASLERGKVYGTLRSLGWRGGSRLDAVLANRGSLELLQSAFAEDVGELPTVNLALWQRVEGLALLPYGGEDLELTAKAADVASRMEVNFTRDLAIAYFHTALNDAKTDMHRAAVALYGLSALQEPVLREVRDLASRDGMPIADRLYVALALDRLGAKEEARQYWSDAIAGGLEHREGRAWVSAGDAEEKTVLTARAAWLAAGLQLPEADDLAMYVRENPATRTLTDLEMFGWARDSLAYVRSSQVKFTVTVDGKAEAHELDKDETHTLNLSPDQLATVRFSDIQGRVGMTSSYLQATGPSLIVRDPSLGLSRRYLVDGKPTTTLHEGDMVKVELTPTYGAGAPTGAYEVTDYLPSGLRPVEHTPYSYWQLSEQCASWVTQTSGQRVSLYSWHSSSPLYQPCRSVTYWARVVSRGTFKAESALIQMSGRADIQNISAPAQVTIQ